MLVTLAGVTGIGKSYFKDKIADELNFKRLTTITTRERRQNEKNILDRLYITDQELKKLKEEGKIAYDFSYLGNQYAYLKEEIMSDQNSVVEIHYDTVYNWKRICPNIYCIYLMPQNIEIARQMLKERNLKPEVEKIRLNEIEEHYKKIHEDKELQNQFDTIIYNNYDLESERKVIDLVKSIINKKESKAIL